MKKIFRSLLVLSALCFLSPQVALANGATGESYPEKVGEKLGTGIVNVVTGFVEIPKNMVIESNENGVAYGVTIGFITGIVHSVGRTLTGALDIATFMIPTKPLIDPDLIWKDFNKKTGYHPQWQTR